MTTSKQTRIGTAMACGAAIAIMALLPAATPTGELTVSVEQLRSVKGMVRLCLTTQKEYFPDCDKDPNARFTSVKASTAKVTFKGLPKGSYALAVFHDENANEKLDTFAGIPKEGIGFSRNPKFTFGPPKFAKALFSAEAGETKLNVRMKYFL
ncbi:DUF2141 domain-containing protein [Sphingorhabdus sp. Alg239-R122]|uniref:DUF2141 domain-containing protein n=1 Tax=Sphingorhabdus sp. Alg239-R122 TaxID=2305989 RepID=UPI001F08164E|nr:DUF2141 domain-containing protein [Sphingorhabdus sp. Alg239-R122]